MRWYSLATGSLTFRIRSPVAHTSSALGRISAPAAAKSASGIEEPTPASASTNTSCPARVSSWTPAGVIATRYSWFLTSRGIPTFTGYRPLAENDYVGETVTNRDEPVAGCGNPNPRTLRHTVKTALHAASGLGEARTECRLANSCSMEMTAPGLGIEGRGRMSVAETKTGARTRAHRRDAASPTRPDGRAPPPRPARR